MISQILASAIFAAMFLLIVTEKFERHIITLFCGFLTLTGVFGVCMGSAAAVKETLNIHSIFTPDFWYHTQNTAESSGGINWATIVFIAGMMVMVEGMARTGFFRWLCIQIANLVHYQTIPIFLAFMVMSAILSMFIDSITVILFLAAVTAELAQTLRFNPVPMSLSEIFCANLGGSATMCGDPPNIIIGTSLGYSFNDFITNTGVMAGISLTATIIYFYLCFRKELSADSKPPLPAAKYPAPKDAITDKTGFLVSCLIFLCTMVLLITHAQTGLTVASIGTAAAAATLAASTKHIPEILEKIDCKTLLFFIGLFIVVSGLEKTGILAVIAGFISSISGGHVKVMVGIIIWLSAVASAFVDNIPFAAAMIPVIQKLSVTQNASLPVLAWALSMGTDIGGSATPIGASANVVGISAAAKHGRHISWGEYCKKIVPATLLVLLISTVCIFLRYF